jgi:hypothetical protein
VRETVYSRTFWHAAQILGGTVDVQIGRDRDDYRHRNRYRYDRDTTVDIGQVASPSATAALPHSDYNG